MVIPNNQVIKRAVVVQRSIFKNSRLVNIDWSVGTVERRFFFFDRAQVLLAIVGKQCRHEWERVGPIAYKTLQQGLRVRECNYGYAPAPDVM